MTTTDDELLTAYIADMRFRNLSEGTVLVRMRYFRKFISEVGFHTATEQKITAWLSRPISPKSRAMWISTISSFYTWANHNHMFANTELGDGFNPVADIGKPRTHARSPRPMPDDDIRRALELAEPRMRAWIALGHLQGCRCMEIAGLTRDDINEDTMTLHLIGKGSKERFLPLHPDVLAALVEWGMPDEGRMWDDETPASVSRKLNRFLHDQVGTKSTAHTLRHAFGTRVYRSCHDLRATQELMGHASPQTTAGYAAADMTQSAAIINGLSL
jgi:integrase/recombinase XerC